MKRKYDLIIKFVKLLVLSGWMGNIEYIRTLPWGLLSEKVGIWLSFKQYNTDQKNQTKGGRRKGLTQVTLGNSFLTANYKAND